MLKKWQDRRELEIVQGWLRNEATAIVGLQGIGGIGKSWLAAYLYEQSTELGFGAVLWADVSQQPEFLAFAKKVYQTFARTLSPEQEQRFAAAGTTEQINVLLHCLRQQRYLLVVDNLETLLNLEQQWRDPGYHQFFSRWLAQGQTSAVLVTTREQPRSLREVPTWRMLEGLNAVAGGKLLAAWGVEGGEASLQQFSQLLNGHPLTLKLAATFLVNYCDGQLREAERLKLTEFEQMAKRATGEHRTVETCLEWILQQHWERLNPQQQTLLQNLSVYRVPFTIQAAISMVEDASERELETRQQLRELITRSLLEELGQATNRRYQVQAAIAHYVQWNVDLTQAHQKAAAYFDQQSRQQRLMAADEEDAAIPYLELFHHCCELGAYATALEVVYYGTDGRDDCDQFLALRGYSATRYQLYSRLGDSWPPETSKPFADFQKVFGDVLQFLKQSSEALNRYQEALQIYRQVGDRLGEANTLKAIGDVLQFLKQSSEALNRYQEALQIYRQVGARLGEANTLKAIGDVLQFLKQSSEALNRYQEALQIYRQVGARLGEANTLKAIGDVLQFLDQRDEALNRYQEALQIYRQVGDRLGEANTLLGLGSLQDDPVSALDYFQSAQQIYLQIGDRYSQGRNLLRFIVNAQLQLGQVEAAIASCEAASAIGTAIGVPVLRDYAAQKLAEIQGAN
ncbi:hypothetical protein BST81_02010 [Leptolyngbya sp. 'hensonii']|nr:hypothetical protein BST81_02010 [Leptolyngbya sp. 'hensonii']